MHTPTPTWLTNMCLITDASGRLLVQHTQKNTGWTGYVFPGGHIEASESITESVIREVQEETGLTVLDPRLCGVKDFFTTDGARYVVFLYKATDYTGTLQASTEGSLSWLAPEELTRENTVPHLLEILEMMQSESLSEVFYRHQKEAFFYRDQSPELQ